MTDHPTAGPAALDIHPSQAPLWQKLSWVWLVPTLVLLVSLGVAWQNYRDQGVLVTITFQNAAGIRPGETDLRYRDVTVGRVEDVTFDDGLNVVLVQTRVDADIAPYLDDDAQFWVARPNVSVRGITGLDTVLSGVYIEGTWDTQADVAQTNFTGLEQPVLTRAGQRGTFVTLRTTDAGSVSQGAPVLHKGIAVGYLEAPQLTLDGSGVSVTAFIESPYDRRLTSSTRFWDTSGFSVTLGAGGVALNVNSLASLIEGGVAFDTIVSGGALVRDGDIFTIFSDEQTARDSLFTNPNTDVLQVAVLFEQAVTGLNRGADVRFQGIRIGEVSDISAIVIGEGAQAEVRLQAVLRIEPARLGLGPDASAEDAMVLLSDFVARGLRARMVTGNILSGSLLVELVQIDDALPAIMTRTSGQFPVIPTTASAITDVATSAEGVLARINALPIEDLMVTAIDMMDSIEQLAASDASRAAPDALLGLIADGRALIGSDDLQAVPNDLRRVIADLDAIISSARQADLVGDLDYVLARAGSALDNIASASENLPQISADIAAFSAQASALELADLARALGDTLATIDAFMAQDSTTALPASLNGALDEMRAVLADIRSGGAVDNMNAALDAANDAARALQVAVGGLPALADRASQLVTQTQAVIASYGERSRFSTEAQTTLRDIQAAADAVTALARAIQRNPNSLITGR
jgi:paraquat-inducible protein B